MDADTKNILQQHTETLQKSIFGNIPPKDIRTMCQKILDTTGLSKAQRTELQNSVQKYDNMKKSGTMRPHDAHMQSMVMITAVLNILDNEASKQK